MTDRERLIELLKGAENKVSEMLSAPLALEEWLGIYADYLLANGVIVPPAEVGQTVYYIAFGKVYKGKCHAITLKPTMQIHLYDYDGDNASISADRVFLTKEEAEKALKERKEND